MGINYEELAGEFIKHPVDIVGIYKTTLQPGGNYQGHKYQRTTKCALLFALSGQAEFIFNETSAFDLTSGKVILGGFNNSLEIIVGPAAFEYYLIHYVPSATAFRLAPHMTSVTQCDSSLDPQMLQMMDKLLQIAALPGNVERLEKQTLFYSLLNRVLLYERDQQNKENYPVIEQAIQYIHQHYMEPITLESISEHCGMKPKYFSYLFHKYAGISPINYLIQYRLNRAHELLMSSPSSIRDIAKGVGYTDPYYFSRLFKKHKGASPNQVKLFGSRNNPS